MKKKRSDELNPKKRTPNTQRRVSNIEWKGVQKFNEVPDTTYRRKKYDLEERLLAFAAMIIKIADSLPNTKAGNHISGQLLRCGTSPLANHGEVEAAESRNDFVHKLRICLKELRETNRWLRLIDRVQMTELSEFHDAIGEVDQLIRIFVTSIRTTLGQTT
jgi:four helix bundle protein